MVQKTGTEVTVGIEAGKEFRRNIVFVKKYNEQDGVSRPNGKENSSSEEVGKREEVIPPTMTGVSGAFSKSTGQRLKEPPSLQV